VIRTEVVDDMALFVDAKMAGADERLNYGAQFSLYKP